MGSKSTDLGYLSTRRLITPLQTAHRRPQFDDVTRFLGARDESTAAQMELLKAAKSAADPLCSTLESESAFLRPCCADLENKIKSGSSDSSFRTKIAEIEQMLKEEKDRFVLLDAKYEEMELVRFAAEEQANKYRRISNELEEQMDRAAEDLALLRARDQRAQEHIKWLQEALHQKEKDAATKFIELKVENQDYKWGKRRAQEEAYQWKGKYYEALNQSTVLYNENIILQAKLGVVELGKDSILLSCQDCGNCTKYAISLEAEETHKCCFVEISSDEEEENHSSYEWESNVDGAELMRVANNCDDYGESSRPVLSQPREGEPLVACIGDGCVEEDDTIPITVLKRKRQSELITKSPEAIVRSKMNFSLAPTEKLSSRLLRQRMKILTPAAIYDVRRA